MDFSRVSSVNLDEYRGLPKENDQSYHYFMQHNFFEHINIRPDHTFVPDGMETDSEKACLAHEEVIRTLGGVNLQLLGLATTVTLASMSQELPLKRKPTWWI